MNPTTTHLSKFQSFRLFVRKVIALSLPYFRSEEKWKARGLLATIIALNLATVYMSVLYNDWNGRFYNALQEKKADVFWHEMLTFCWIAGGFIVIGVYRLYLTQLLQMRWRQWMTNHFTRRWLSNNAFYHLEVMRYTRGEDALPDNPDQRLAVDMNLFTSSTVGLTMGLLNAVVTLFSFVGILWGLSGGFSFNFNGGSHTIPGFMVWAALLYCLVGSVLTHFIGRPLIGLNFRQEQVEANYRHHLIRTREYSESIALDRGERVEEAQIGMRFSAVLGNYLALIRANKRLTWFTAGFGQAAVVFPFIVAAPRYFSGSIQMGVLMQVSNAFGEVQGALSWFVDNYDSLASWRATTDRLTSFEESFSQVQQTANATHAELRGAADADTLLIDELQIGLPDGAPLVAAGGLALRAGDHVLVRGPSGAGKSTLFRTLAGIWPWARTKLARPTDFGEHTMFLPQRPYFPNGALRNALAYPEPPERYNESQLQQALRDAELPQLAAQLDREDTWGQKLSGGEQQRLAMARVFLKQPRWLFVDEASSALDEDTERTLYQRLRERVAARHGALVSIAHRPGVAAFHEQCWEMQAAAGDQGPRFTLRAVPQT